jgi:hypothetical protein
MEGQAFRSRRKIGAGDEKISTIVVTIERAVGNAPKAPAK